ncbi:nucleotide sugar dehydrogenase [Enterovirga aerilata]|uniref:Nucleotide sugar dehydrogenase n=1 Tax=Enterovirga aerilata TaxID=2730920 RepID=A0A849IFZ7_9HYPH|nr:nucleotide sugar dehydrogenase [Enterovirga sp. DB1703]NNM74877.1 nucleotide sugar dehydrogenase [Enterovirga sp. DB1703]
MTGEPVAASPAAEAFIARARAKEARIGIIGLGYVGLPLARAACQAGFRVLGFDIDPAKVAQLNAGGSYIRQIEPAAIAAIVGRGLFAATADFDRLGEVDAILVCVPTPLGRHREPDLSFIEGTAGAIAPRLRAGQLVVLESTTYPGTTRDVMRPILESSGLRSGKDFFLAYSPEREDPGNAEFGTAAIPRVVGGDGPEALAMAAALYGEIVPQVVPVSSPETAEAVKLTENIFRSVNIALMNELKVVYAAMGIDIWEVIEAAKSKPFGFMPFYPGPGLGGHCIPIDPFYLTWKAREHEISTRFIELAGEVNASMPGYVVERLAAALDRQRGRGLNGARILILGVAYKKNVDDQRESPGLRLIELLEARGVIVGYHDPWIPEIRPTRDHPRLTGRRSLDLSADVVRFQDAVLVVTDHDAVDYKLVAGHARLVVDTRNVFGRLGLSGAAVVKA